MQGSAISIVILLTLWYINVL